MGEHPEPVVTDVMDALHRLGMAGFRFECFSMLLDRKRANNVYALFVDALRLEGDVAECGVYDGGTSVEMVRLLEEAEIDKTVHLFDTFDGFPDVMTDEERQFSNQLFDWWNLSPGALRCPVEIVRGAMTGYTKYAIHQGTFAETFPQFNTPLCFIYADADLYQSTVEIVRLADRVLVKDGIVVFDDYGDGRFPGVTQAVSECLDDGAYRFYVSADTHQAYAVKR